MMYQYASGKYKGLRSIESTVCGANLLAQLLASHSTYSINSIYRGTPESQQVFRPKDDELLVQKRIYSNN